MSEESVMCEDYLSYHIIGRILLLLLLLKMVSKRSFLRIIKKKKKISLRLGNER